MKVNYKCYLIVMLVNLIFIPIFCETLAVPPSNFDDADAGSENNPFLISNLANLRWLSDAEDIRDKGFHFLQTNDIDATETKDWSFVYLNFYDFKGFSGIRGFRGEYNGQNYKISNLYSDLSFFTNIKNSVIKNVILDDVYTTTTSFIGRADDSVIWNCHATGKAYGDCLGSSFIGFAFLSTIEFCSSSIDSRFACEHMSFHEFGGLVRSMYGGRLANSYFNGNFQREEYASVGFTGLVAEANDYDRYEYAVTIENCFATTKTPLVDYGLVYYGYNLTLLNNFWDIEATGTIYSGGGTDTKKDNFGLPTAQMKQASTYIARGWDFDNVWAIAPDINDGYPHIRNNLPYEPALQTKEIIVLPSNIVLSNYPNPFNPETTIKFSISQGGGYHHVKIDIYNIKGQKIRSLVNMAYPTGEHSVVWNGTDDQGNNVGSGVYFYNMQTDRHSETKKMLLIK